MTAIGTGHGLVAALLAAAAVALVACGGDDDADALLGEPPTSTPTLPPTETVAGTTATVPSETPTPEQTTYTVVAGDTLSAIAQRFNTTVAAIAEANGIADPNVLEIGQVLIIPPPAE